MIKNILGKIMQSGALDRAVPPSSLKDALAGGEGVVLDSISPGDGSVMLMAGRGDESSLVVMSRHETVLGGFDGEPVTEYRDGTSYVALVCPLSHDNAAALRKALPRTAPSVLETRESFGTGDRIGSPCQATPWHLEACASFDIAPVAAQQSVRENHKTGRTFESVMDDVTWSVFETGFDRPWGSDADHLKTLDSIEEAVAAGFTMFTLDPSDMIDGGADTDSGDTLARKLKDLFPSEREIDDFIGRYAGKDGSDDRAVARTAVKYLPAVRHAIDAWRLLVDRLGESRFNFEMSIDETSTATTLLDHRIIASELLRAGVRLFSLAPRFAGSFEKGIDYIGSLDEFRRGLTGHVMLSRELGGYRLSLHSGSDKFSVYPIFGEETDGFFHVKTAGTSFLEAVKVVARADFDLFREILALAVETFAENAASYEISGDASKLPAVTALSQDETLHLIDVNPDMRQTLHIAFGVILGQFGASLKNTVRKNGDLYRDGLVSHLGRHLSLLTGRSLP